MLPLKRTSGFFLLCALSYGVLMASWPVVQDAYRACFCAGGNLLYGTFGRMGATSFSPIQQGGGQQDTQITLRKRIPRSPRGYLDINSNHIGYRPTAFMIALALATPISWSRRWRALVWGLAFVQCFVAMRVGLSLLDSFSNADPLAIYSYGPSTKKVLQAATSILFKAPGGIYIGPMFIWLAVTFRRGDMAEIFGVTDSRKSAKPRSRRSKHHS